MRFHFLAVAIALTGAAGPAAADATFSFGNVHVDTPALLPAAPQPVLAPAPAVEDALAVAGAADAPAAAPSAVVALAQAEDAARAALAPVAPRPTLLLTPALRALPAVAAPTAAAPSAPATELAATPEASSDAGPSARGAPSLPRGARLAESAGFGGEAPTAPPAAVGAAGAPADEGRATVSTQAESPFLPMGGRGSAPQGALVAGGLTLGVLSALGIALYHRIRPNAALENDTRKAIFEAVCAQPGLGVHAIAQAADVSYSTATYHLERLVGAGMIVMTPNGNKLCYYKNGGAFSEAERKILPLLKNAEASKLLEAILDTPGTYRAALAERLGVTATTINWHLKRLRDAGLIDEKRQGRNAHLYARAQTIRDAFPGLQQKVGAKDPDVMERLTRFVRLSDAPGAAPDGATGAA